jgi:hypothetical protein
MCCFPSNAVVKKSMATAAWLTIGRGDADG